MTSSDTKSPAALGFLTVIQREPHGLFGGYLLLNLAGRPLEFHCTAPLKPNRAQEILYGPTLEPFLYGEHIGRALIEKSSLQPIAICTNREAALAVREFVRAPVALVLASDASGATDAATGPTWRIDAAQRPRAALHRVVIGRQQLGVKAAWQSDESALTERLRQLADDFDLAEPFARIEEAIDEAQRAGR
jgi:hypothetical protein